MNLSLEGNTFWREFQDTYLQLPYNWEFKVPQKKVFEWEDWELIIYSHSFSRGEVFYIEILPNDIRLLKDTTHKLFYQTISKEIPLNQKSYGFNAVYVFPPEILTSQNQIIWEKIYHHRSTTKVISFMVQIQKYPMSEQAIIIQKKTLPEAEAKELKERIEKEKEIKKFAFLEPLPFYINHRLSHPRDYHQITSEWYKYRKIQYYEILGGGKKFYKPYYSIHKGVDLKGKEGDVVYAIADGKVVISREMYYEGNFIVINHGNQIYSGYMHLKDIFVLENSYVKAGMEIGTVGSTGLSTAPHLHYSLWIDGYSADPLSILNLPIR